MLEKNKRILFLKDDDKEASKKSNENQSQEADISGCLSRQIKS